MLREYMYTLCDSTPTYVSNQLIIVSPRPYHFDFGNVFSPSRVIRSLVSSPSLSTSLPLECQLLFLRRIKLAGVEVSRRDDDDE